MTALVVALLIQAATIAAFFMRARAHEQRIDRLISLHAAERAQTTPDLMALLGVVENLCQRIQAPAQAVIDHSTQLDTAHPGPAAVHPDVDDSYWEAHGLPKDELADQAFAAEQVTPVG